MLLRNVWFEEVYKHKVGTVYHLFKYNSGNYDTTIKHNWESILYTLALDQEAIHFFYKCILYNLGYTLK